MSGRQYSSTEVSSFCGQMALILSSGVSAAEGINIMVEDSKDRSEKEILQQIYDRLLETGSLGLALEETQLFPPYMVKMISIGETTGTLDEVMSAMETHYSREAYIRSSVKSSLLFPMIMICMMIIVILILLVKVMPVFNQVFIQLGSEMTGFSSALLHIGNVLGRYSLIFIAAAAVIAAVLIFCFRSGRLRKAGYRFKSTKAILESIASCRFASALSLTLKAGLTQDAALELVSGLSADEHFRKKLESASEYISKGSSLIDSVIAAGIFTGVHARLARIGEKTGRPDSALEQIASLYQQDTDERISRLLSVIEPVLVVVLSLIVGVILISVMLPLLGIMSGL